MLLWLLVWTPLDPPPPGLWPTLAKSNLGQSILGQPCVLLCVVVCCWFGPSPDPPRAGPPSDRPKFRSFPLSHPIFAFFDSLGVFSSRMLVVFSKAGTLKKARLGSPHVQIQGSWPSKNTTKIPREDIQRDTQTAKNGEGEGKMREMLGLPPFRAPPFRAPRFTVRGPTIRGSTFSGLDGQNWFWPKLAGKKPRWPKMDWPKLD